MKTIALFFAGAIVAGIAADAAAQGTQKSITAARCTAGTCTHIVKIKRADPKTCHFVFDPEVLLVRRGAEFIRWEIRDSGKFVFQTKALEWKFTKSVDKDAVKSQFPGGKSVEPTVWQEKINFTDPGLAFYYKIHVKDEKGSCSYDPPIVNDMGSCPGDPPAC